MSYRAARRKRPRPAWALGIAVAIATAGCFNGNGNGHDRLPSERRFAPRNSEEAEAVRRMRGAIDMAAALLRDPALPAEDRHRLSQAIDAARWALDHYQELRRQGDTRAYIIAGIGKGSAAIVADDITVAGAGDNLLLVPAALAAIATYIFTNAPASSEELAQAWMQVAQRIQELSTTLEQTVHMTAVGRHADTGIMQEVYDLLGRMGLPPNDDDNICRALAMLMEDAKNAGDTRQQERIKRTQKARRCRRSRHNRE